MTDIFSISTNELVAKMREGQISSVEVCKAYIERINKFEKDVKAWNFIDKKILLEKAEEADEYRKTGKPLGSLHGLPIAVKDIFGTYDMPTECGTIFRKKMSASQDSEVVNLIKNVNNIIIVGAMANNFLIFKGFKVGKSLVEENSRKIVSNIYAETKKHNCNIFITEDYKD